VLRYSREQYIAALQAGTLFEDGAEEAFEVVCEINERHVWIPLGIDFTSVTNKETASELVNGLATALSTRTSPIASTTLSAIKSTPSPTSINLHTCSDTCLGMAASMSATRTSPSLHSPYLLVSLNTRPWFSAATSMQPTRCCPTSLRIRRTRSLVSSKAKVIRTKHSRSPLTLSTVSNSPSALVSYKLLCSSPVRPTSSTSGRLSAMLLLLRGTLR